MKLSGAQIIMECLLREGVDTIFGYPGLAMLLFLAAAGGGFWMAWTILAGDVRMKR